MGWKSFEEIEIWQRARRINREIWELTRDSAIRQDMGIVRQMLDSSGSMMDNIAEGFERGSNNEFKTFLGYAKGSAGELRSQLIRLHDRGQLSYQTRNSITSEIMTFSRMTKALIKSLKGSQRRGFRID